MAIAEVWSPGKGIQFFVDRNRHRILKIEDHNLWAGYCPERGVDDIIYCRDWLMMLVLTRTPCPHIDEDYRPIIGRRS